MIGLSPCLSPEAVWRISRRVQSQGPERLIKELDLHPRENAGKFLAPKTTYVLVRKILMSHGSSDEEAKSTSNKTSPAKDKEYRYEPLLDNWKELYPSYRPHFAKEEIQQGGKNRRGGDRPGSGGRTTRTRKRTKANRSPHN
ncbi:Hypp2511 [Branchiostoma lanceolatum]|uniref:Hypp2511 protein n=1 Tax=Branchiostoma lanceolatum TaxID=7740 RepID=A0A8J9ZRE3_BRALA|nr:Hypp2511 [Branchiostoma lanceolatum]